MKLLRKCHAISILTVLLLGSATRGWPQAAASEPAGSAAASLENLRIVNIVFDPARQPLEGEELFELLPVRRGEPYHAADVRTAIERLYATGRYEDIQVDASRTDGGVLIRFVTKGSWFTGNVTATGNFSEPPTANQIVNVSRLRLGDPFDPTAIPAAVESIRKLLTDNGYFNAKVEPLTAYDETYRQVNVVFRVTAGKRAHYTAPAITPGNAASNPLILTEKEILRASGWRHRFGAGYNGITATRTTGGIDRIRLRYQRADRVLATVTLRGIQPDKSGEHGTPQLTVNPGPGLEIRTEGAKLSPGKLRSIVPVYEEHAVDSDLLAEGADDLRDYFQSEGYFDAAVSAPQQHENSGKGGAAVEIDYTVNLGMKHRLVLVGIRGNKYFAEATIRERMLIAPRSFELRRGRYSDAFRKQDIDAITALYQSNGFRDVKVTTRVEDNYRGRSGDLAIFFTIDEGAQYIVARLDVKGPHSLDISRTLASLSSQAGQPFSEFSVAEDREAILEQYGEHGFARATFEWNAKPGARPHTVDLEFTITEGEQQFVREVVISGLHGTRPNLVNKQIELNPGDPLSPAAMADTQRKLDDLGIFAAVNMAVQNPDGDEDRKYVLYDLDEARRYSLTVAPGAEFARLGGSNAITDLSDPGGATGFSPRISVNLTRLNLLGRAQTVSFQGALSNFEKRALMSYTVPKIFNLPRLDATFSILYDDSHDVRTFQSVRKEASAQVVQHVSKAITAFYRFSYRHVGVSDLKIDPLLLPQLAQSVRVGMLSFNLVQDRRDDPVDPHKGIYNTLETGVAARAFTSQTSFVRVLGRNATYYRLGRKMVFARETEFGVQPAFSVPANSDPTDPIPLPERFFGGGGNSLRAFPENQAGPRDALTGFPLGGSALFYNNAELRFPLYGANVNGVLFEDAGNIYSSLGAMSFRTTQQSPTDFNYMVHAAGFGVRYRTPVGPLRVDFAYSINPPRFNGFPGNYTQLVDCSAAGTCQASPQQISHFQFFFSIGQAF